MTIYIIKYLFLFLTGAILGWGLEVVYRKYFGKARAWINPGFLSGPYLPLYGFAVCILYVVCDLDIETWQKLVISPIIITLVEYLTGTFFLKYYKTRLWDYRKLKFNFQGHIAPLYTIFWSILSAMFYFGLYPYFYTKVEFLYKNLELSLFIGIIYGIMLMDMNYSLNIVKHIKNAVEMAEASLDNLNYDNFKMKLKERLKPVKGIRKPSFMLPFKGEFKISEQIKIHLNELRVEIEGRRGKGE